MNGGLKSELMATCMYLLVADFDINNKRAYNRQIQMKCVNSQ